MKRHFSIKGTRVELLSRICFRLEGKQRLKRRLYFDHTATTVAIVVASIASSS